MIKNLFVVPVAFLALLAIHACNPLNPAQDIPSYITIDTISFEGTDPAHGTSNQKISDAWVYVNDNLIGAFELPTTFPVLSEGKQKVMVIGGIRINGIAATRTSYPYFQGWTENIDLKLKETTVIKPIEKYNPATTFRYTADFENGLNLVNLPDGKAEPQMIISTSVLDPELNGTACGGIFLEDSMNRFSIRQKADTSLFLPTGGRPVFLELNYKSNHPFSIGIISSYPTGEEGSRIMTINPSANWNKIYVNLTAAVNENFQAQGYNLWFFGDKLESIPRGEIYLDNIKVLY
ncbi:MAG: hypothetical protein H0X62_10830 [Bacteroidetes bacterium]|nr:hypothetical protein [Bacteroidota bacterium]